MNQGIIWSLTPGDNTNTSTHPGDILWGANSETGRVRPVFVFLGKGD